MDMFTEEKPEVRVSLVSRDQNDFRIIREDPYGHWVIKREKGAVPERLKGMYTKQDFALSAIKDYLETFALPRPIKEVKHKV